MEALDQRFRLRIGHRVQRLMRMAITAEKVFQSKHIAALGPADDHRAAGAGLEQADTAQDQGAHDPLAELRLGDQQGAQPVRRNDQGLNRPACAGVHQGRSTRQLREFAQKSARAVGDDQRRVARSVVPGDVDIAGQDDAQPMADGAHTRQRFAGAKRLHLAKPPNPLDLGRLQIGKHLVVARVDDRF